MASFAGETFFPSRLTTVLFGPHPPAVSPFVLMVSRLSRSARAKQSSCLSIPANAGSHAFVVPALHPQRKTYSTRSVGNG